MITDVKKKGMTRLLGRKVKDEIFQLIDHYTLFYYEFINGKRHSKNYWQAMQGRPQHNTWCGLAFERVCLWHIDLCEMKYSKQEFAITENYEKELIQKKSVFMEVTRTKNAVHTVMITSNGLTHNAYTGEIQNELDLNDLFL